MEASIRRSNGTVYGKAAQGATADGGQEEAGRKVAMCFCPTSWKKTDDRPGKIMGSGDRYGLGGSNRRGKREGTP